MPLAGATLLNWIRALSCPTIAMRTIEFQGVFSQLSHRNLRLALGRGPTNSRPMPGSATRSARTKSVWRKTQCTCLTFMHLLDVNEGG